MPQTVPIYSLTLRIWAEPIIVGASLVGAQATKRATTRVAPTTRNVRYYRGMIINPGLCESNQPSS